MHLQFSNPVLLTFLARPWAHTQPSISALYLFAVLAFGAGNASAQQTAVCSEAPGTGERIDCTEDADSSDDIDLTLKGVDIDTTADDAHGVSGHHEGTGKVFVAIQTGFDEGGDLIRNYIDTTGATDLPPVIVPTRMLVQR